MINFLLEKNKREVKKEYFMRLSSVFLIVFSLIMILVIVFITPAYILSIYRKVVISDQLLMIKNSSANQKNISLDEVKKTNEIIKILSLKDDSIKQLSSFMKSIISIKGAGVTISNITLDFDTAQNTRINIKGFSKTREDLTRFVKGIKGLDLFSSVDLPISSLIKGSDIDFGISLMIKKE